MLHPSNLSVRGTAALLLASPALGHALTTRRVATPEAFVCALGDAMASTDSVFMTRVHAGLRDGDPPDGDNTPGSGDPGFVAASNPCLRAGSVLVDSGVSNPAGGSGTFDADGRLRMHGASIDIGAFEFEDTIFSNPFEHP
jgi:hypothetical protein